MKKGIGILTGAILIILISILVISKQKRTTDVDCYYTIPKISTYHYEEGKRMTFEVYVNNANSLIEYEQENQYFIESEGSRFQLSDVEVSKQLNWTSKEEVYYKYRITSSIINASLDDLICNTAYLIIKNTQFDLTLELGFLAIYKKDRKKLDFSDLYGNYAYVDNELHMIGLTLQLASQYKKLHYVKIGKALVLLEKIEKDILYDSERTLSSLNHSIIQESNIEESYPLLAHQNYYFLPLAYSNLMLITEACVLLGIDEEEYYIEDFTYLANDLCIANYLKSRKEGKVRYA